MTTGVVDGYQIHANHFVVLLGHVGNELRVHIESVLVVRETIYHHG